MPWAGMVMTIKANKAPEGVYLIGMSALNSEGTAVTIASQVSGKVDRVFL
jgi:hypothetical protein